MLYYPIAALLLCPTLLSAGIHTHSVVESALHMSSRANKVPYRLLKAICKTESGLDPKAFNQYDGGTSSYGLCQVKFNTARQVKYRGSTRGLFNPYTNASLAGRYLRHQLDRYSGDWIKAISAYNRGTARLTKNRKYVNLVLANTMRF